MRTFYLLGTIPASGREGGKIKIDIDVAFLFEPFDSEGVYYNSCDVNAFNF